ncbi:MAG: Glu-tRNA(Gln) amidotransferase subunit GatD [Thermoplasmata archaeon]
MTEQQDSGEDSWEVAWKSLQTVPPGSEVELLRAGGFRIRGTLVPAHVFPNDDYVQIKLTSGYNIGVRLQNSDRFFLRAPPSPPLGPHPPPEPSRARPAANAGWVGLLSTGGTIASRVDYRTGGVRPVREEAEILRFYPNLDRDGPVRVLPVLDRLSEEIVPEDWVHLAQRVAESFGAGARGVVVAHGTDTLAYTAAALSFALTDLPGPVVMVGAQRSPDRPSSDGYPNLLAATSLARQTELGEVVVVMHSGLSDTDFAIHRGPRVRKMHTSRRDAFRSRNGPPLGFLHEATLEWIGTPRPSGSGPVHVDGRMDPRGCLLWVYPGLSAARAEAFVEGNIGIILAGTGLGHTASTHLAWIRRSTAAGVFVGMTSQCLEGAVDPYVYSTGRMLLDAGVTYLGDMLPEVAYTKLLFALGRSERPDGVSELMTRNWAGEFSDRREVEV